jgi:hypothetical protein
LNDRANFVPARLVSHAVKLSYALVLLANPGTYPNA